VCYEKLKDNENDNRMANMEKGLYSKIMEATDARIKMTSKTMKNMRILKLH